MSVCSAFDDPVDCYWAWSNIFKNNGICNRHAPYKEVKIRSQSLSWITPQIRHVTNQRYEILPRRTNKKELWRDALSSELRNKVMSEVRKAKWKFYTALFAEAKDCKSYWKLVKETACCKTSAPIIAIKYSDGETETSDLAKVNILNEHFATIGEKLVNSLPPVAIDRKQPLPFVARVTPTITTINLMKDVRKKALFSLNPDKASGPGNVSSQPTSLVVTTREQIPSQTKELLGAAQT